MLLMAAADSNWYPKSSSFIWGTGSSLLGKDLWNKESVQASSNPRPVSQHDDDEHHILTDFIISDNGQITHHHVTMPHSMNHYQQWNEVVWDGQREVHDR
jgi:hypothetical protein